MYKEFVTFKQALALKELGFDEPCFGAYANGNWNDLFVCGGKYYPKDPKETTNTFITKDIPHTYGFYCKTSATAPLYQQAFRWFREKYGLNYVIVKAESWFYTINGCNTQEGFQTYEKAESACLDKLIEIVKL